MAQAMSAAPLQRLPDRGQAECLAGVDRQVEVGVVDEVERVEVARRREACLGAGDVEADHALVAVADGELGNLDRSRELAHRGDDEAHLDAVTRR